MSDKCYKQFTCDMTHYDTLHNDTQQDEILHIKKCDTQNHTQHYTIFSITTFCKMILNMMTFNITIVKCDTQKDAQHYNFQHNDIQYDDNQHSNTKMQHS